MLRSANLPRCRVYGSVWQLGKPGAVRTWMQETLVQDAKEPQAMTSRVCCHPLSKALSRYLQLFPFKCPHGTSIRA